MHESEHDFMSDVLTHYGEKKTLVPVSSSLGSGQTAVVSLGERLRAGVVLTSWGGEWAVRWVVI